MKSNRHVVDFNKWCPKCKHRNESEFDETSVCYECVESPINYDSHKPVLWEEDNEKK